MEQTLSPKTDSSKGRISFVVGSPFFQNTIFYTYISSATFTAKKIEGTLGPELHYTLETSRTIPELYIVIKNDKSADDQPIRTLLSITTKSFGSDGPGSPIMFGTDKTLMHVSSGYQQLLRRGEPLMPHLARALSRTRTFFINKALEALVQYESGRETPLKVALFYQNAIKLTNDIASLAFLAHSAYQKENEHEFGPHLRTEHS
jgi:hypothetical protein